MGLSSTYARIEIRGVRYEVDSVTFNSDLATPLPPNATTFVGTASASATVVISGQQHLDLHPLSFVQSPVLGARAVIFAREGEQPEVVLLTGTVSKSTSSGITSDGQTVLEIVDLTEQLHSPVTFPAGGAESTITRGRQEVGIDAIAAVIHCLQACGVRVTPPPRPQAVWSAPMVGGIVPEIGSVSAWRRSAFEQRPQDIRDSPPGSTMPAFVEGPYGPSWDMPESGGIVQATWPLSRPSDGAIVTFPSAYSGSVDWLIECYVNVESLVATETVFVLLARPDRASVSSFEQWTVRVGKSGLLQVVRSTGSSTQTIINITMYGNPVGWNYLSIGIRWAPSGSNNIQVVAYWQRNQEQFYIVTSGTATAPRPAGFSRLSLDINTIVRLQNVTLSTDPFSGSLYNVAPSDPRPVRSTDVEYELLGTYVRVIPDVNNQDSWEVLQEIARVTGCSISASPTGVIEVRSLATNQAALGLAPTRTLSADSDFATSGEWVIETAAVRNVVRGVVSLPSMRYWVEAQTDARASPFRWPEVVTVEGAPSGGARVTTRVASPGVPVIVGSGVGFVFQGAVSRFVPSTAAGLGGAWTALALSADGGDSGLGAVQNWGNFRYRQISAMEIEVEFENFSTTTLFAAYPSSWQTYPPIRTSDNTKDSDYIPGSPALEFWGWRYENSGNVTLTVSTDSRLPDVDRNVLVLDDSEWRQDESSTSGLLTAILDSTAEVQATGSQLTLARPDLTVRPGDSYRIYQSGGPKEGFDSGLSEMIARVQSVSHAMSSDGDMSTQVTLVATREWVRFADSRITRAFRRRRGGVADDAAVAALAELSRFPSQTIAAFNAIGLVAVVDPISGFGGFSDWRGITVAGPSFAQAMVHEMWHAIDSQFRTALPGASAYVDASGSFLRLVDHPLTQTAWQNLVTTLPFSYGASNRIEAIAEIGLAVTYERSGGASINISGFTGNPSTYLLTYAAAGSATVKAQIVTLFRNFAYMPS